MTYQIELTGINGGNPLGFLAALGTVRCCDLRWPQAKISWHQGAFWYPIVHLDERVDQHELVEWLSQHLRNTGTRTAWQIGDDLKITPEDFATWARKARSAFLHEADGDLAAWIAAFGSEAVPNQDGMIQDTALRTMAGAGHQHFVGFMRGLAEATTSAQIKNALFGPWTYESLPKALSMRWDPDDDRHYALRWQNPSSDKIKTVRGANRLAVEAIPFFTTQPSTRRLQTTGFHGSKWRWPIWIPPISCSEIASVLGLRDIHRMVEAADQRRQRLRHSLAQRGIADIYTCERVTRGKFRNFTPAQPV